MKELRAVKYNGFVCAEPGRYACDPDYQSLKDVSAAMEAILKR